MIYTTITLHQPDGTEIDWSQHALADVIRTVAEAGGEDGIIDFFDRTTLPIDEARIDSDTIHLEAFSPDDDYDNGMRWIAGDLG